MKRCERCKKDVDPVRVGTYRVGCGDSTDAAMVDRLFAGAKADLVVTSPPYAQQRDYGAAKEAVQDWDALMRGVFENVARVASETCQVFVNLGLIHQDGEWVPYWDSWVAWFRESGWRRFGWYVWDKLTSTFRANDGRLWGCHEWVFHFNRKSVLCHEWVECKHAGEFRGGNGQRKKDGSVAPLATPGRISSHRPPDTVIRIQRETDNRDASVRSHPARFPVALAAFFLETWPGVVYEPFGGSGSTLVAAIGGGASVLRDGNGSEVRRRYSPASHEVSSIVRSRSRNGGT